MGNINMRNHKNSAAMARLPLFVAMVACLYGTAAMAQESTQPQADPQAVEQTEAPAQDAQGQQDQAAKDKAKKDAAKEASLGTVTVTGSLIRRQEYETISPVEVITADTSVEMGQVDAAEYIQKSSVASGSTQFNNQFGGFVLEGGTGVQSISLRGLGAQRSLVLLNGHRPGPAGTRGQVGAFDLNVIPSALIQRVEILKDGASSIYGSDAVAGVVNIITRADIDSPEFTISTRQPLDPGGGSFSISGATGWKFDNGNIVAGAQWQKFEPLKVGDRSFFSCPQDLAMDANGNRIDREDRSITAGTSLGGCNNLYANTVIDALYGDRYIPSPDGSTIGLIPGYRPRQNGRYNGTGGQAYYEDVLNFDFYKQQYIINKNERMSAYASSYFSFENFDWNTEVLFTRRETKNNRFRQFFPLVGGATSLIPSYSYANDPDYVAQVPSGLAQPVIPFRSNTAVTVNYFYVNTALQGLFKSTDTWSWSLDASYSRSDGDYTSLGIVASRSGDVQYDDNAPVLDYFSPGILSGRDMDALEKQIGQYNTGNTVYDQSVLTGIVTGDLFELPAGAVGAAFGVEHRRFSIDDNPSALSQAGDLWGQSSAQVTKGDDNVTEAFGEVEVPLLKGLPGVESLTANASARAFKYNSVDKTGHVWKVGLSWQVIPSLRLRATRGTSYRAPGLYELFLGNQTAFLSQLAIDPCIDYQNSTNTNIKANCAAAGIPGDFTGGASSATIISGGGAGVLKPETSNALTAGFVFTPTFADFSLAVDYFEYTVNDEISQLGGGAILGGCYGSPNYPNAFCNLFDRNSPTDPTAPNAITVVRDSYLNVNKQKTRGYDMLFNYNHDFAAGNLEVEGKFTYVFEDFEQLFDTGQASGFDTNDLNGTISRPTVVGNVRTAWQRNDWTVTWFMDYVNGTEPLQTSKTYSYFGFPNAVRDIRAEARLYHGVSLRYTQPKWSLVVGVNNLFNAAPPVVSSGVATRYGNVPAFATQYDWYGRSAFANFSYKF